MPSWETTKHALIAILVGALVQIAVQMIQLLSGFAINYLQHVAGMTTGAAAYLWQSKTHLLG